MEWQFSGIKLGHLDMRKPEIEIVLDLLRKQYGRRQLEPTHNPLAELVQTILSQNTSDANSRPAYNALTAQFTDWEDILEADIDTIAAPISRGGLGKIKAQRIQQSLQQVQQIRGKLDLSFLDSLPLTEARNWLTQLPGVGNKTANCVLLFALGKPALPVDTHIFRISKRLGLLLKNATLEEAHQILEKMVSAPDVYEFHVLMIEHGRHTCAARHPRCTSCILFTECPSYRGFTGNSAKKKADSTWQKKNYHRT